MKKELKRLHQKKKEGQKVVDFSKDEERCRLQVCHEHELCS